MENQNSPVAQNPNPVQPPIPQNNSSHMQPPVPQNNSSSVPLPSKVGKFRRLFYQVLIGCLISSSAVGVIAVLAGGFNATLGRAIATIAMVAIHSALSFVYITESEKRNKNSTSHNPDIFSNTVFTLLVISFITSVFAIWQLIGGEITVKLYGTYGVILFATLHAEVLYRIRRLDKKIDSVINANYISMSIVVIMLIIVIFASNTSLVGNFYYRILSAIAIIDAAMTITSIIMQKLYLQKHPEIEAKFENSEQGKLLKKSFFKRPFFIILMIFIALQFFGAIFSIIIFSIKK